MTTLAPWRLAFLKRQWLSRGGGADEAQRLHGEIRRTVSPDAAHLL
jgi:hypothetical protein